MLSSITWHAFSHSLSTAVDATPHVIVVITIPATIMLTMSHLYPCKQAYKCRHSVISCEEAVIAFI